MSRGLERQKKKPPPWCHVLHLSVVSYVSVLKRTRAAVTVQKNVRMWAARRSYQQQRSAALTIQSFRRAQVARKRYRQVRRKQQQQQQQQPPSEDGRFRKERLVLGRLFQMLLEQKAVVVQKWVRGWLERRRFRRALGAAVVLQCCVRCWRAKKALRSLRTEARSVQRLQKLNVGMENKIMQLQHKINEQVRRVSPIQPVWMTQRVTGSWRVTCTACVCVCTLPLQHREMAELSQLLCSAEALLASEREANGRRRLRSEQEAREQEEKIGAVWEELSLLQQELDDSRRDKAELEEQMKVDKEETQQVRPGIDLSTGNEKVFPQTCFPTELRTSQQALFLFVVRCSSLDDHLIESPDYHSHGSSAYNLLLLLYPHLSVIRITMSQGIFKLDLIVRKGKDFHCFPLRHR